MANEKETPKNPTTTTTTTSKGSGATTNAGPGGKTGDVPVISG
ncbi:hypothetical protein POL68_27070 [Stigmatella sp. ncwal1]|uniref:Uncharacterized protein n=1 Tax=Stigmatella ashevillensis TaxID=2995309 RepID=A0ABT5DHC7_9BACT|nr:hypothetical protein [Stigmatella ashevillena]MDC0712158.1 hypothetical protein [Stigmatella ashevillena]